MNKKEVLTMATKKTERKPLFGNKRSHALNITKKKQKLNKKTIRDASGKKVVTTVREAKKAA